MLNRLRQTAPAVALLICVALLATWLTGAHAHRHLRGYVHEHTQQSGHGLDSDQEHGNSHALDSSHATTAAFASMEHDEGETAQPHSVALIHADGHEDVEVQALLPPSSQILLDLPLLALVFCAVFVLTRSRAFIVVALADPPHRKHADRSLRPPLRGPPLFSIA